MAIRQQQVQKQVGKLTPQQMLEQELLQLNMLSLEQYVNKEIEENPVLEKIEDEGSLPEEHAEDNEEEEIALYTVNDDGEYEEKFPNKEYTPENGYINSIADKKNISIYEILQSQILQLTLDKEESQIADQIIGNIDSHGYFTATCSDIADYFLFTEGRGVSKEKIEKVLHQIQSLDPPGVATRNLEENLLLQIKRRMQQEHTELLALTYKMLETYFSLFSAKKYDEIMHRMHISNETLSHIVDIVEKLNPFPISIPMENDTYQHSIDPDFTVTFRSGELEAHVHQRYIPKLRINDAFLKINTNSFSVQQKKEANHFIHNSIQRATHFVEAIKMRFETLTRIIKAIADTQVKFFQTGDETLLVPMLLKDIATITHRDISTISRAVSGKYIDTDWGIKPVKFFFNQSIKNADAPETTHHNIEQVLLDIIEHENKLSPYTDDQLTTIMKQKGYPLSRRTILTYRQKLKISTSNGRKRI